MTATPLHVLILAAGEGKRMKSASAKVLMPLAGRPLLAHVIAAARSLSPAGVHVVYGHNGQQVRDAFAADAGLGWIEQRERLGTGHAVRTALEAPEARRRGLFQESYVAELLAAPDEHRTNRGANALWQIALLEIWLQTHGIK